MTATKNDVAVTSVQTTATIASSGTASAAVDLGGLTLCGLYVPATFTGTALTFQTSLTLGGTYVAVLDDAGGSLTRTVAQGKYLPLDPSIFAGIQFLKVVSGSTEGAARDIILISRPV